MRRLLLVLLLVGASVPAWAGDIGVGVSISIGDPNFYGRIEIGDFPEPRVVYRRPVVIERVVVVEEPLYLRVPPGHSKNWRKYCRRYDACGRRVYFIDDRWYNDVYVPRYRERYRRDHDDDDDERYRRDRDDDEERYRRDRDDDEERYRRDRDDGDHDRGHSKGRGKGHGKGHKD